MRHNLLKYWLVIVLAMVASTDLLLADCYKEVVRDTIIVVEKQYIGTTDTIVLHDTCTLLIPQSTSANEHSCWYNFWLPLVVSILGAFGALYLTYLFLRPKFEIDPIAARSLNNELWFMVRNKSIFAKLYSIKAELSYVKYNEEKQDFEYQNIELDRDDEISIMYREHDCHAPKEETFYVFHTKYAFFEEPDMDLRLRVSATNTISNIYDAVDQKFTYENNVKWGEFIGGNFVSVEEIFLDEELRREVELIESVNEVLAIFLRKFKDKYEFIAHSEAWQNATNLLRELKTNKYNTTLVGLTFVKPTITETLREVEELRTLYEGRVVYSARLCDKRNEHIDIIKRDIVQIAQYMNESITLNPNNNGTNS